MSFYAANFTEKQCFERDRLFELLDDLTGRIKQIDHCLKKKAKGDRKVELLLTHKGIGSLSALAVVHTLGDSRAVHRAKKSQLALDPLDRSSAGRVRMGSISKAGSSVLRHLPGPGHACCGYDGQLKAFYKRLATKRTKAIAKTAATRSNRFSDDRSFEKLCLRSRSGRSRAQVNYLRCFKFN
jgi:transposase